MLHNWNYASQANRELAGLLRRIRTKSKRALFTDTEKKSMTDLLTRADRCVTKQNRLQAELGSLALRDELTGLFNRRGFMALAERQLKLGRRSGREMLLFFLDVDRLKQLNDTFGHSEGDRVLKRTAEALERTFRDSDLVARVGGDEFAVLAIEASGHSEDAIRARLWEYVKAIDLEESRYSVALSSGVARFDPHSCASIAELIVLADQAMYEEKRRRYPGPELQPRPG